MPFVKSQVESSSGNPAGTAKRASRRSRSIRCDVRRSTDVRITTSARKAPELIDLAVRKALVGNDASLAACLTLLASSGR